MANSRKIAKYYLGVIKASVVDVSVIYQRNSFPDELKKLPVVSEQASVEIGTYRGRCSRSALFNHTR